MKPSCICFAFMNSSSSICAAAHGTDNDYCTVT
jgi:hypothetical protein